MLVDGNKIAKSILVEVADKVAKMDRSPRMTAVTCAPNFETQKYLEMKKRKAASVGVVLNVVELPADAATQDVVACVNQVEKESDGVVVQLPLPEQINRDEVLSFVSADKDPDGFAYGVTEGACLSPVVGAIDEISKLHSVEWEGKIVVILGEGRLVGLPAAHYAETKGAEVSVLNKENYDEEVVRSADIIVTGVGSPHLIRPEVVKEGVVIFDAGTSEDGGILVGDVAPAVSNKAALLTPVPGGIGPITIAYLLSNLVKLSNARVNQVD